MYLFHLFKEATFVGIFIMIVGYIVSSLLSRFFTKKHYHSECKDWNKNHIMEIALFLTGFMTHLLCEYFKLNLWYCKHGAACK
jgi:hypothetical protein